TTYTGSIGGGTGGISKVGSGWLTLAGPLTFTGNVSINSGELYLTGSNTYTHGTFINQGVLNVTSDANLGGETSGLQLGAGTIRLGNGFSSSRSTQITSAISRIEVQGTNHATINAQIFGAGNLN